MNNSLFLWHVVYVVCASKKKTRNSLLVYVPNLVRDINK